jgi:hypothetical protein
MAARVPYNPTPEERKNDINFASLLNGVGSLTSAQTLNLSGVNNNPNGTMAPTNKDSYGLTFFTRPDLNMSYDNIARDRMLTPLLSKDGRSMARALRCLLAPRLMTDSEEYRSDIIDNEMAFIPVLTNNLISISGWPDFTVDTYTSKKGVYNEEWSMIDSSSSIFSTFNLTANFKNIQGDPISLLFFIWVRYASLVYDGTMTPWFDNVMENTIDYNTRIYRIVLNEHRTYVQKIAACGAAFPMASPLGNYFNYTNDSNFNYENDQISIPFKCMGANYMDPILIIEFNATVEMHCPSMKDSNRLSSMVKISVYEDYPPHGHIGVLLNNLLRNQMYPRIDPLTLELEWWAKKALYEAATTELKKRNALVTDIYSAVHTPPVADDASLGTSGDAVNNIA